MSEITARVEELEDLKINLTKKWTRMQDAAAAFTQALQVGKGDFASLGHEAKESSQEYQKALASGVEFIRNSQKLLRSEVEAARKGGVIFDQHGAEASLLKDNDSYDHEIVIDALELVQNGMGSLQAAIENFEALQLQINQALDTLKDDLAKLKTLEIARSEDDEIVADLDQKAADVFFSRETLLAEIQHFCLAWQERIDQSLETQIDLAYQELDQVLERLVKLETATDNEIEAVESLKEMPADMNQQARGDLLEKIRRLRDKLRDRADEAKAELEGYIEELKQKAEQIIAQLHPKMPEVIALDEILQAYARVTEDALFAYWNKLDKATVEADEASTGVIKQFRRQIKEDSNYIFTTLDQVEIIGTALVYVSRQPEQYGGPLWAVGEDVLIRVELANLAEIDEPAFFERYGYPAIRNAIVATIQSGSFVPLLSLFASQFSPSGHPYSEDGVKFLFDHPTLQNAFQEMTSKNILKLKPDQIQDLNQKQGQALFNLLRHGRDLKLPPAIRLQWAALLHNRFELKSPEHYQISYLFLQALLDSAQFLALYYSLQALEPHYGDFWTKSEFRPLLYHCILQAHELGFEGRKFMTELCTHKGPLKLAQGDFGSEFLWAALAHHAVLRWGKTVLFNDAWAAWDKLASTYPVLAEVLHRELQGEHFSAHIVTSAADLKREFNDLISDLSVKIERSPSNHPAVHEIHHWYLDKYFRNWLEQLSSKKISKSKLKNLSAELLEQKNKDDLLEDNQAHSQTRMGTRAYRGLPGTLKMSANNRLFELLTDFEQAISIRKQILSKKASQPLSTAELKKEITAINQRSHLANWAFLHLLAPGLPFIPGFILDT